MGSPSPLLSLLTDDSSGAFYPPRDSHTNPDRAPADGSCSGTFFKKKRPHQTFEPTTGFTGQAGGLYVFTLNVVLLGLNVYIIRRVYSGLASFVAPENALSIFMEDQRDESQVLKAGLGKHP